MNKIDSFVEFAKSETHGANLGPVRVTYTVSLHAHPRDFPFNFVLRYHAGTTTCSEPDSEPEFKCLATDMWIAMPVSKRMYQNIVNTMQRHGYADLGADPIYQTILHTWL